MLPYWRCGVASPNITINAFEKIVLSLETELKGSRVCFPLAQTSQGVDGEGMGKKIGIQEEEGCPSHLFQRSD